VHHNFYAIKALDLSSQLLYIQAQFLSSREGEMIVNMPAWRPGRYELLDFAKKITNFQATDEFEQVLNVEKINKHSWKIFAGKGIVKISYNYCADVLDAGNGCFFNHELLYINPCTCLIYTQQSLLEPAQLKIEANPKWKFSTSLDYENSKQDFLFNAENYHALADSPILLSPILQQKSFEVKLWQSQDIGYKNCLIKLSIFSRIKVDLQLLQKDFEKFILQQGKIFSSFPQKTYEFQLIFTPHKTFHGVEHYKSTVICLGPDNNIFDPKNQLQDTPIVPTYNTFLEVASHEFFHFWNVKAFKPQELVNIDYSKESFSDLHYVTEGITSFYEDLMLLRAGLITDEKYHKRLAKYWQFYADNSRFSHLSLAQSSFESWLDGYSTTSPHRNNSFYVTGKLVAFVLDVKIKQATSNQKSLDNFMQLLYKNFGDSKGYQKQDILKILLDLSGQDFQEFFDKYIYSTVDLEEIFIKCLDFYNLNLVKNINPLFHEQKLGFKLEKDSLKIKNIYPDSPANKSGLMVGDEIVKVGEVEIMSNQFNELLMTAGNKFELVIKRFAKDLTILLELDLNNYYTPYNIV
jgi:predicted metalloprotease with PDZ domain